MSQALVYDVAGRVQHHFTEADLAPQQGRRALPLPSAAPGLYLLRVVDATGQTSTPRFVRQRAARALFLLNKGYSQTYCFPNDFLAATGGPKNDVFWAYSNGPFRAFSQSQ